jgi:hypothetical protein
MLRFEYIPQNSCVRNLIPWATALSGRIEEVTRSQGTTIMNRLRPLLWKWVIYIRGVASVPLPPLTCVFSNTVLPYAVF